jgi:predicted ATPase/DNA-binding SARP family transcriptional activator
MSTIGSGAAPLGVPSELTPFIGRATELRELERLLGSTRLLTLTGAGGSGKTRLALELAERAGAAGTGVAWVELAALEDASLIPQQVAYALGVRDEVRTVDALTAVLRARGDLLVLDNCEHLVDACAELAHSLLRGCPELRVLATSREALGVKGERAWLVPPLSLPAGELADPREAGSTEAVRLFVERARDGVPEFELTPSNVGAVVEICRRLDGVPLAIELAAARVRVLPPEQIRERLDDAFRLLTSGGRTSVPRHRTLRAAIDWSHDLLRDASKVIFRRQAVFRGGFTLEAAEAVCSGDGVAAEEVLDLVARLVDRSLLEVREQEGVARYGPLETVRQYALEQLAEAGEAEAVRRRHAAHLLARAEAAAAVATTPLRRRAFEALLPEMDNLRDALAWTRRHDPATHVRLAGTLGWFWFSVGHWAEARRWMEGALSLATAEVGDRERAELLFACGAVATLQADVAAGRPWLEESVARAEAAGAEDVLAYARNYLGMTYVQRAQPEGEALCQRAAEWFRAHGDDYGLRLALLLLGLAAQFRGEGEEAVRLTEEAVAVARRFGQDRELSVALQNLALLHLMQGHTDAAGPILLEAISAARRDPSYFFIATTLDVLGELRIRQGLIREAGRVLGAAEAIRATIAADRFEITRRRLEPLLAEVEAGPAGADLAAAVAEGRALRMEEILDEVLGPEGAPADEPAAPSLAARVPRPGASGLRVSALGPMEVVLDGVTMAADAWPYAKPKELLVLLMLHPAGRTREQVGRALWPGASAAQVKNSFHVTLHHLRKALGDAGWVVIEGDRYRLAADRPWELDANRFDTDARAALAAPPGVDALRSILAGYRGDLLEGEVAGAWVEDERDRLRRLAVDLGLALGAALEAAGDERGAVDTYHAIAVREELNEEALRRLMAAWSHMGDRPRALRQYERLVTLLRDELDAEPEPETVRLYESLRVAAPA